MDFAFLSRSFSRRKIMCWITLKNFHLSGLVVRIASQWVVMVPRWAFLEEGRLIGGLICSIILKVVLTIACFTFTIFQSKTSLLLPTMYLIDSIIKNVKKSDYVQHFSHGIVNDFCFVFEKVSIMSKGISIIPWI